MGHHLPQLQDKPHTHRAPMETPAQTAEQPHGLTVRGGVAVQVPAATAPGPQPGRSPRAQPQLWAALVHQQPPRIGTSATHERHGLTPGQTRRAMQAAVCSP